ncbi:MULTISPECIES: tetratricopeptide repeat protein [unclassified Streptomyces]|uniref:tetratricopeptide repeat protein n=1 Tax=unclassified Streptomyces TaxID=2593676 RepID=UPI0035D94BD4
MTASGDRSIAAANSIRQAFTGDGASGTYVERSVSLPPEAFVLPDKVPAGLGRLPDRTGLFVGRERELGLLDTAFESAGGVVVHAVHGLGGIGKSTLAARWAARHRDSYELVWWITAESAADLDTGLADLAVALQPGLRDALSREALREGALRWLAEHEGWLLVLDNVSSPADVQPLLERATGGRYLIMTRRATGWHGVAETLSLDVLPEAEAVELFQRVRPGDDPEEVARLCQDLGCLPLAVEQAAAYCAEAGVSAGGYRELLAAYPEELFATAAQDADPARTVARVWRVSLDRLVDTPLASVILSVIAWWAPEDIPRAYLEHFGSPVEVAGAIGKLAAHSLVTLHDGGETLSVHRLVQAVARTEDADDPHRHPKVVAGTRELAAAVLRIHHPDTSYGTAERLWLTHLDAFADYADPEKDTVRTTELFLLGGSVQPAFKTPRQLALNQRALTAADRVCGPRSELALRACAMLAIDCRRTEDWERAVALGERIASDSRRVYGRKHPETFKARASLAVHLIQAGEGKRALRLARTNARKADRVLGATHPVALECWAESALVLGEAVITGTVALDELETLLARVAVHDGEDGAFTNDVRSSLVAALAGAGDIAGAIALQEEVVAWSRRVLGDTDQRTLLKRNRLVFLLAAVGETARGRELVAPLLADWRDVVGDVPFVHDLRIGFAVDLTPRVNQYPL